MAQDKNTAYVLQFEMRDSAGALQAGKTVTPTISKDKAAAATPVGTITAIGGGLYAFNGTAADFNCDSYSVVLTATGCIDTVINGNTESGYTGARAPYLDRVNTALPNVAPGANGGLPLGDASGRVLLQPTQTGVTIPTVTTLTGHTAQTGDTFARLGAPTGASIAADIGTLAGYVDTEVAAIKAKTDNLPSDPADASDVAGILTGVTSALSTIAGYIDTEVAAIKAKTDNLPSDPADASDITSSFGSIASTLSTISGFIDTEIAAIKAKTDNLPATPASQGDVTAVGDKVDTAQEGLDTLQNLLGVYTFTPPTAYPGTGTLVVGEGESSISFDLAFNADKQVTSRALSA